MTKRIDQINSTIHRAVQSTLSRGLNDPRGKGLISITKVNVSPDMSQAVVEVSVLPTERADLTLKGLTSAAPYIQRELAKAIRTRRQPRLIFKLDTSVRQEIEVYTAIARVNQEDSSGSLESQSKGAAS